MGGVSSARRRLALTRLTLGLGVLGGVSVVGATGYLFYAVLFPLGPDLAHDEAQHLHIAFLLSQGQRPFLDFLDHHPTLFAHGLWWLRTVSGADTTRAWATLARVILAGHVLLALGVVYAMLARVLEDRPRGVGWGALCLGALALVGLHRCALPSLWPFGGLLWQIRPDWLCHAYTLLGVWLGAQALWAPPAWPWRRRVLCSLLGGVCVGVGNAIIPKGVVWLGAAGLGSMLAPSVLGRPLIAPEQRRRCLALGGLWGLALLGAWSLAVLADCRASGVPLGVWWRAVIRLNALPHVLFDINPIATLIHLASVGPLALLALLGWLLWELLTPRPTGAEGPRAVLVGAVLVISGNLVQGPLTNGLLWPYYFAPAALALVAIYLVLLLRLWQWGRDWRGGARWRWRALAVVIAGHLLLRPLWVPVVMGDRARQQAEARSACATDYVADGCLPHGLTYWVKDPHQMPVLAPHWGYYFVLVGAPRFWQDAAHLGLGPPLPQGVRDAFVAQPPDVIAIGGPREVADYVADAMRLQHVDLHWLLQVLPDAYHLLERAGRQLYARHDHTALLARYGWRPPTGRQEESWQGRDEG
jgi:hypothetical protein